MKGADMSNAGPPAPGLSSPAPHQGGLDQVETVEVGAFLALPSCPGIGGANIPKPTTWAGVVTASAVSNHGSAQAFTKGNKHAPTKAPASSTTPKTTHVIILRDGSVEDQAIEERLWYGVPCCGHSWEDWMKASAACLVLEVRTAIECATADPIRVVDGMWSRSQWAVAASI